MFETQTILEKMTENDISSEEYSPAEGAITSLSQLTKEQFHDLMSSDHPSAKNYRDYAMKEFEYRVKSYQSLNDFFNLNSNT
jgi:hypothetical protein